MISTRRVRRRQRPVLGAVIAALAVFVSLLAVNVGPVAIGEESVAGANTTCTTNAYDSPEQAKDNFGNDCGGSFQNTPDFRCDWTPDGWVCSGPSQGQPATGPNNNANNGASNNAPAPAPVNNAPASNTPANTGNGNQVSSLAKPQITTVSTGSGSASLVWTNVNGAAGYNVYRDGNYLTTVNTSQFRESVARGTYTYYVTAFTDGGEIFSERSNDVLVRADRSLTYHYDIGVLDEVDPVILTGTSTDEIFGVTIGFFGSANADQYRLFRDGVFIDTIDAPRTFNAGERLQFTENVSTEGRLSYRVDAVGSNGAAVSVFAPAVSFTGTVPLFRGCMISDISCERPFAPHDPRPGDDIEVFELLPSIPNDPDGIVSGFRDMLLELMIDVNQPVRLGILIDNITDPDGDGINVLLDNDNDNDGVQRGDDPDDFDPSVGGGVAPEEPGDQHPDPEPPGNPRDEDIDPPPPGNPRDEDIDPPPPGNPRDEDIDPPPPGELPGDFF